MTDLDRAKRTHVREVVRTFGGVHALAAYDADARALWAVRVIDAWADATGHFPPRSGRERYGKSTQAFSVPVRDAWYYGATRELARLAAARAVYPEIPADVRAELGECP